MRYGMLSAAKNPLMFFRFYDLHINGFFVVAIQFYLRQYVRRGELYF